ncbi:MAG: DUF2017 family protein [Actinomycetota bacterium]
MPRFERIPDEGLRVHLEGDEAEILRRLIAEMQMLLEAELAQDPVNQRLFPQAYEDAADSSAYNELIGDELRNTKKLAARTVLERLGERGELHSSIPEEEVDAWLTLITDLRLAIGTRLGVTEETMADDMDTDSSDAQAYAVMHWLGWLQESILTAQAGDLPEAF